MTKQIMPKVPLWKVAMSVVCLDETVMEYADGKPVPYTKVSTGNMYVHGTSLEDARARAVRVMRNVYDEHFLNFSFTNTHEARGNEFRRPDKGFADLELKLD